jgi:hypothetical protein
MAAWRVSQAILAILIFALWLPQLLVAQPLWQTGTLEAVEKKLESTPRTYVWDVVVTSTDVITYRLHIKVANRTYVTDYTPDIQPSALPTGWEVGRLLQLRPEQGRLLIRTSYGELATYIRDRK